MELLVFLLAAGGAIFGLERLARSRQLAVTWYDRLIAYVGIVSLAFGLWHFFGSQAEGYGLAGFYGLLIFGGVGVIMAFIAAALIQRRSKAA